MPVIKLGSQHNTKKRNRLTALLFQNASLLSHNPLTGELILEGCPLESSNFLDRLSNLYQSKAEQNLTGNKEFLNILAKIFKGSLIKASKLSQFISSKEIVDELVPQVGRGRKRRSAPFEKPPGNSVKVLKLYP